jgi:hypothetical protein
VFAPCKSIALILQNRSQKNNSYVDLFFSADFRSERFVELQFLFESGVTISGVSAGPQPSGSHLRVNLLHDLAEVSRRERFQTVLVAVLAEKIKKYF